MADATIDREELRTGLTERTLIVIDVLPKEYYGECHVAGACNACVYEVTFLEQVKAITADKDAAIVVYGSSGRSRDAVVAAEKLAAAGYRNVRAFTGGLHEWR
ncbi:MAG TPA: sulfurtransferase, partial [Geobacter sulfurreducens]|nr:sulfurtransferase [Geobacter sulfurreducens]